MSDFCYYSNELCILSQKQISLSVERILRGSLFLYTTLIK